jgi:hypothetical protein
MYACLHTFIITFQNENPEVWFYLIVATIKKMFW